MPSSPAFKPALFIYFDGSFKNYNNKNVGSIGYIIKNQGGDILYEDKKVIDNIKSNTESEYISLEISLKTVLNKYGPDNRLFIFGDEKTIIDKLKNNNLCGRYKDILMSILSLTKKFNSVVFAHISQSENKRAHTLSNNIIKKTGESIM